LEKLNHIFFKSNSDLFQIQNIAGFPQKALLGGQQKGPAGIQPAGRDHV